MIFPSSIFFVQGIFWPVLLSFWCFQSRISCLIRPPTGWRICKMHNIFFDLVNMKYFAESSSNEGIYAWVWAYSQTPPPLKWGKTRIYYLRFLLCLLLHNQCKKSYTDCFSCVSQMYFNKLHVCINRLCVLRTK